MRRSRFPNLQTTLSAMALAVIYPWFSPLHAQTDSTATDSSYISFFQSRNDFRVTYGTKGSTLTYGSSNQPDTDAGGLYNNVVDLVGFGLTYKWIDFDLSFSLPQTRLLPQGIQNLKQFRLSGSIYGRAWTLMGYWRDNHGMVASDANGEFESTPDLHLRIIGAQFTYNFHSRRYSYKAATYQNEHQRRSAGSFLLRTEPYFRKVGVNGTLVPPARDLPSIYGNQTGLQYVNSPGLSILPGYGHNFIIEGTDLFISPLVFAGGGVAYTQYAGNQGEKDAFNLVWSGSASLNFGFSGKRIYLVIRASYETSHFNLNPSYFGTTDVKAGIFAGYRFSDLEKGIPRL